MSGLCCIGGVCIPYTAILPLCVWALKWLWDKLLVVLGKKQPTSTPPQPLQQRRSAKTKSSSTVSTDQDDEADCCSCCGDGGSGPLLAPTIPLIESEPAWSKFVQDYELLVIKFTAPWCQPCRTIQGPWEDWMQQHGAQLNGRRIGWASVNVDSVDAVAAQYSVAALPTFLVLENPTTTTQEKPVVVNRYSGSAPASLYEFLQHNVLNYTTTRSNGSGSSQKQD